MFFTALCWVNSCFSTSIRCGGRSSLWLFCIGLALSFPVFVAAQDAPSLTLTEVEQLALADEPTQIAFSEQAVSARALAIAAGQLPDPTLRLGAANLPIESGGFTTEGMSQLQFGVRQALPGAGRLKARGAALEAQAEVFEQTAQAQRRQVRYQVRQIWLDLWYWQQATELVQKTQPQVALLAEITTSLYRVGRKNQQDLLRAELELQRLADRLLRIDDRVEQARVRLAQWIGAAGVSQLSLVELPDWSTLPAAERLQQQLLLHPSLRAADARIIGKQSGVAEAEASYKPDWAVDLNYGLRNGALPAGTPRSDFMSLMVSFDLPLFPGQRQDQKLVSAQSDHRAARYQRESLERSLMSELALQLQRWQTLGERIGYYDRRLLGLAVQQTEAALSSYQSEAGDFAELLRTILGEMETRLEYNRLRMERAQAYARIAELGGVK